MILVTGGLGYIGSHTVIDLLDAGYKVVVVDNLSNSAVDVIPRINQITSKSFFFEAGDIRDGEFLNSIFKRYPIASVIHFAGLKSVAESLKSPNMYFDVNVTGTLVLLDVMEKHRVFKLVYSSSATVYGIPKRNPICEHFDIGATCNPYGTSKFLTERILSATANSNSSWAITVLRYFNPIGAHESGLVGESPSSTPANLVPYLTLVAIGKLDSLAIYGNDYETPDGTGIRDYIHVLDLAAGHIKALEYLDAAVGIDSFNLGTGKGYSVLDVVENFNMVTGLKVNFTFAPRRLGDVAVCFSDPSKANRVLKWSANRSLEIMLVDAWRWQSQNPDGYV
ncbi:UDP-glucose 4-epimerase GalE [Pseudomonadales bacterium]|nr:UDP-glucose 4-epimerase GalE [Pseudomonadales bacterium]